MNYIRTKTYELLRSSERFFKTDMVYLAKGGFWLGISQVAASGSAFVLSIFFARLISRDAYGEYRYILSLASVMAIATLSGIDTAVSQAVARHFDGSLEFGLKAKLRWGLITTLLSFGCAGYYFLQSNIDLTIAFCIAAILIPFHEAYGLYASFLQGKKLFRNYTLYTSLTQIGVAIILCSALFFVQIPWQLVGLYLGGIFIFNFYFFILTKRRFVENNNVDSDTLSYGKHLSALDFINTLVSQVDKILVFHFLGAAQLAVYAFAVAPPEQIKGVLKNLQFLALPKLAEKSAAETKNSVMRKAFQLGILTTIIIVVYIILAPLAYHYFFPQYTDAIRYSQVYALSTIGVIVATFLYTFFTSQAAKKELSEYNIYSNIFNIIVLVPLIFYWGIWGAIIARLLGRFFLLGLSLLLVKKI